LLIKFTEFKKIKEGRRRRRRRRKLLRDGKHGQ